MSTKSKLILCCGESQNKYFFNKKNFHDYRNNPANICWSWRRLQDMCWRRLRNVFSVTIFRLPRRLENVLEDEKLLRWRRLEDKQNVYWKYLYLKNLNLDLINLYLTYLYLTNQRLQHLFSVTLFGLPRRLEDVLKTSRKTSWRRLGRQKVVTLKTSSRRPEDMSSRYLQDVLETLNWDICI